MVPGSRPFRRLHRSQPTVISDATGSRSCDVLRRRFARISRASHSCPDVTPSSSATETATYNELDSSPVKPRPPPSAKPSTTPTRSKDPEYAPCTSATSFEGTSSASDDFECAERLSGSLTQDPTLTQIRMPISTQATTLAVAADD